MKKRVAVAMSGGVDSSVAALLLLREGYDVIGITHQTWPGERRTFDGCCGLEAIDSARAVASKLGIPYYVLDLREDFKEKVISKFCCEYILGRTPNPCILCNQLIRFRMMLDKVLKMGMDYMATGHYALIDTSGNGYKLLKGIDPTKDQSYFLYTLGQNELQYILFPTGKYLKTEIRKIAADMNLPSAIRKESQDICFIPHDYREFIKGQVSLTPGDIIDIKGKKLGEHKGLALYTVGQRHGLGIYSNEPYYVIQLDNVNNRVTVGPREFLKKKKLLAGQLNWISGKPPEITTNITAKIRYKTPEQPAKIIFREDIIEVEFLQALTAITPGQSIVFYRGKEIIGGGIIESSMDIDAIAN
jgi:tRNA-uridine 2-sulfurtransferase